MCNLIFCTVVIDAAATATTARVKFFFPLPSLHVLVLWEPLIIFFVICHSRHSLGRECDKLITFIHLVNAVWWKNCRRHSGTGCQGNLCNCYWCNWRTILYYSLLITLWRLTSMFWRTRNLKHVYFSHMKLFTWLNYQVLPISTCLGLLQFKCSFCCQYLSSSSSSLSLSFLRKARERAGGRPYNAQLSPFDPLFKKDFARSSGLSL